jgi:hypothetical protein
VKLAVVGGLEGEFRQFALNPSLNRQSRKRNIHTASQKYTVFNGLKSVLGIWIRIRLDLVAKIRILERAMIVGGGIVTAWI